MLADAAAHAAVVTVEDGYREGGIGAAIADRLTCRAADEGGDGADPPRLAVLGIPVRFIPHGKPDAILGSFGLDGSGIATTAREVLSRR
jgi:1-deoxy-D-xylulose-5-phosphate synthase